MADKLWSIQPEAVTDWSPRPIARGGFGEVYSASYFGSKVAVKQLLTACNPKEIAEFQREIDVWYKLTHPHILPLLGACDSAARPFMVSPFMPNGTLKAHVADEGNRLSVGYKARLLYQTASGMAYLHSKNIVHGDLKTLNILLDNARNAIISDFGMARTKHTSSTVNQMRTAQPVGGTLDYMAPEMLDDENPAGTSKKTDVYAFAITIYEVFKNGQPIWVTRDGQPMRDRAIESQVTRGNRPARIDAIPDDIWSLVERCWRQDPGERPTFAEILAALDPYKNYTAAPPEARPNSEPAFSKAVSIQPNGAASKSSVPRIDRGWSSQSSQSSRFRPSPLLAALVADLEALPNIPRLLLQRARQGEIKSCFDIARLISEGKPATDPLWGTAARLYQVAADKDNLEAFFHLGWLHLTGIGTTQSDVDALTYWTEVSTKSTDAVHQPIATMMAGWLHHLGRGTRQDKRRAAELMRQSRSDKFTLGERIVSGSYAASCDSPAAVALFRLCQFGSPRDWLCEHIQAICHLRGFGTSKDEKQAVAILEKLANQGHDDSQHILGKCYGYGWGVASSSAHSFPWYSKAADQGNLYAQNMVGRCLQDGSGVPKDPLKAAEWLRKAAEQGNSDAQSNLGWCYQHGSGVAQDFTKAIDWYNRSVDQENRYGCYNLAYCFQNGIGVVKDNTRACELFKKSAELDYSLSQSNLAECLEKGLGVPKDIELAVFWYHKAAAQGNSQAKQRLQELGR